MSRCLVYTLGAKEVTGTPKFNDLNEYSLLQTKLSAETIIKTIPWSTRMAATAMAGTGKSMCF